MAELFKALTDLGFSPLNCVLLGAVLVVWRVLKAKDEKQTADREAWHAETRKEVEEMKGHVRSCDDDRQELRRDQTLLKERLDKVTKCPRKDCPMRFP